MYYSLEHRIIKLNQILITMSILLLNKTIHRKEKEREKLVAEGRSKEFLETYKVESPNFNTGIYWDNKFENIEKLEHQDGMTKDKIKAIASLIPHKNIKILDLGIGQGYLEQFFKKENRKNQLFGIDVSKISIERSKREFSGEFIVGDILNIEKYYKKNFFDVIVAIEVIEHVSPNKIFGLYKKVYNLLKLGGLFIISTPLNEGLENMENNPSAHVREYTIPVLEKEFEIARFQILKKKTHYAFSKKYYMKKLIAKIVKKWKPNNIIIVGEKVDERI